MIRWLTHIPVSAALLVTILPGCSGGVATDPPTVSALGQAAAAVDEPVTRAPIGATTHGKVKRIGDALGQVDLRADQRASLEALALQAEARQAPTLKARDDLAATIASQVEAGAIDHAALQPKIDALVAAMRAQQPGDRAAFESVHAILDPPQREAFVEAMRSSFHGMFNGGAPGEQGAKKEHGGHPLAHWATDLGLSEDQVSTLRTLIHAGMAEHHGEFKEGMGRGHALLEAFTADTFHFDDVQPAEDPAVHVTKMTSHVLDLADKALPLLTPGQRSLAAAKVREHALSIP
jgi:Spy/CpxP family protein refolding chaperone